MDLEKIVDKVRKLLALANNNPNEAEASLAAQKAQDLLAAYNLDMSSIGNGSDEDHSRSKNSIMGGAAEWQRQLWNSVAQLNFCLYFYERKHCRRTEKTKVRLRWHHQIIGKKVNVLSTVLMCEYLENVVERLTREAFPGEMKSNAALAFREGLADRIRTKIYKRRDEMLAEEKARSSSAANGQPTKNALVLATYTQAETDANWDVVMGEPGYSARVRREAAERRAAEEAAAKTLADWEAANPEEAAKRKAAEEAARAKEKTRSYKYRETGRDRRRNHTAYYTGWDKGKDVSLEPQVSGSDNAPAPADPDARRIT